MTQRISVHTGGACLVNPRPASAKKQAINNKLKPCPFCGEIDKLKIRRFGLSKKFIVDIICNNCGATSPFAHIDGEKIGNCITKEHDAIKAWNKRA